MYSASILKIYIYHLLRVFFLIRHRGKRNNESELRQRRETRLNIGTQCFYRSAAVVWYSCTRTCMCTGRQLSRSFVFESSASHESALYPSSTYLKPNTESSTPYHFYGRILENKAITLSHCFFGKIYTNTSSTDRFSLQIFHFHDEFTIESALKVDKNLYTF